MDQIKAIEMAKNGDNEGMAYLYETTYQKSYYVALKYMKNEHSAMDVLQDAYIKAFENIDKLDSPEKFESWMKTIVAHTALNELRKNNPMLFSETENDEGQTIEETFEDDRVQVQPEIAMDQKETSRLVQEMMEGLSDEQRVCITMFYMEEMSVKEIANVLNVSENTVKSRLNYGRNNIKEKVLELEKRGTKLYGVAPFVFFLMLFKTDAKACNVEIPAMKMSASGKAAATGKAAISGKAASGVAAASATAAGKTAAAIFGAKQIAAVISAVTIIGGITTGVAVHNHNKDEVTPEPEVVVEETQEVVEPEEPEAEDEEILVADEVRLLRSGETFEVNGKSYSVTVKNDGTVIFSDGEKSADTETELWQISSYLLTRNDKSYIYVCGTFPDVPYRTIYIWDLQNLGDYQGKRAEFFGALYQGTIESTEGFWLQGITGIFGSCGGRALCTVGEDGNPEMIDYIYYDNDCMNKESIDGVGPTLTALQSCKCKVLDNADASEDELKDGEISAGQSLVMYRTDGENFVDLLGSDNRIYRVYVEKGDSYYTSVNGIYINELFEGIPMWG